MILDNHEQRLAYYELVLKRTNLADLPDYPLPEGYRFQTYRPGDEQDWIRIEIAAKEIRDTDQGMEVFERYFGAYASLLPDRMVFIEDTSGRKVATATAWWDIRKGGPSDQGVLHWVAVDRSCQGRGLARPLIAHVLRLMDRPDVSCVMVPTQTTTWLACRLYLDFGFCPAPESLEHSRTGWRIMRSLTEHPVLYSLPYASLKESFPESVREETVKGRGSCHILLGKDGVMFESTEDGTLRLPRNEPVHGATVMRFEYVDTKDDPGTRLSCFVWDGAMNLEVGCRMKPEEALPHLSSADQEILGYACGMLKDYRQM